MHLFSYPLSLAPHIHRVANNTIARSAISYSIVDDLAQTPIAMSALEVVKNFLTQRKALLAALRAMDPSDPKLITFDMENEELWMPSTIAFQILVSI